MNLREIAPRIGAGICLLTALVVAIPFIVVEGRTELLNAYYAAGPTGAFGVAFFALVGVVAFASAERGNVDPETMAGGLIVLAVAIVALAGIWWLSLDDTVLFSFPQQYRWLEYHPPAVFLSALGTLAAAGVYAREVLAG